MDPEKWGAITDAMMSACEALEEINQGIKGVNDKLADFMEVEKPHNEVLGQIFKLMAESSS